MAHSVHYEVFKRQGAGGWVLVEVCDQRDDAFGLCHDLEKAGVAGAKIVKETYNEATGDYLSLNIHEYGKRKINPKLSQEDVTTSPCFKVDDLYSYHARRTIAALIPDFLAHNTVTVTELGHRADLLEKLEATDTLLQHAVQRVAVAQAATTEIQLPKIIRTLHDLVTQLFQRVYRDEEKGRYVVCKPGEFHALANKLADSSDGAHLLNGTITRYLRQARGWDDKVRMLMALMAETKADDAGAKLLLASVDALISDLLGGAAGLRSLIGARENHGEAVTALIHLFLGREPDESSRRGGLTALTKEFRDDSLPNARVAVANRIVTEIRSFNRLVPQSLEEELRALRKIANLVVMGVGKYLSHEDLVNAFVLRSQRLITNECLAPYLSGQVPDAKLERILFVEENVLGAENKRRLYDFVPPVITGSQLEEYFQSSKLPLLQRLSRLEALRDRAMRSGFQDNQKAEIADALDRVAASVEAKNHLFESIDRRNASSAEKAVTLIRLLSNNSLTAPRLTTRAREMVIFYVGKPGFLASYAIQMGQSDVAENHDAIVADLMRVLEKAGITSETGLKNIAA